MTRRDSKVINIGGVLIGGNHPISIQSMTNTKTSDIKSTISQIDELYQNGCDIIRIAVPNNEAAQSIKKIKERVKAPLVADIHFDYKLAITAIDEGVDGIRLNPGNIGSFANVLKVVERAKVSDIPIRIGVNGGSLDKKIVAKYGYTENAIVESALSHVSILEKANFEKIKISVKTSSVPMTINSYRLLASKCSYPLHLGLTEAGTEFGGSIKSSIVIGTLLSEGIGDTIRVSLTEDPIREVIVAKQILKYLEKKRGLNIVSCPTCGRTEIDLLRITKEIEKNLIPFLDYDIKVAVMGCVVNGPMEAKDADYAIAAGVDSGLIYKNGKIHCKVKAEDIVEKIISLIKKDYSLKQVLK